MRAPGRVWAKSARWVRADEEDDSQALASDVARGANRPAVSHARSGSEVRQVPARRHRRALPLLRVPGNGAKLGCVSQAGDRRLALDAAASGPGGSAHVEAHVPLRRSMDPFRLHPSLPGRGAVRRHDPRQELDAVAPPVRSCGGVMSGHRFLLRLVLGLRAPGPSSPDASAERTSRDERGTATRGTSIDPLWRTPSASRRWIGRSARTVLERGARATAPVRGQAEGEM